ncbi:unnamed protein product [Paramecium sonneborni]|uniref:Uncharacterized protein n=1 Tax=Paramecium sonneborni TaxID=65129 RepID=A0A8S1R3W7_9CILI|nr:unnamed protein product [Paramecium sonneborni]
MSIFTMYQSRTKSALSKVQSFGVVTSTPLKTCKPQYQDRQQLYNNQLMQKALIQLGKKAKENKINSHTYQVTDTIVQANQDTTQYNTGKKQVLFRGIDSQSDPTRNLHYIFLQNQSQVDDSQ